jgi:tetratricopeptide (TPR) repeat protein
MNPKDFDEREAFLAQAEACLGENRYQAVLDLTAQRLRFFPGDIEAGLMICRARIGLKDLKPATECLDDLDQWINPLSDSFFKTAKAFQEAGFSRQALRCYRMALALNPDSPMAAELSGEIDAIVSPEHHLSAPEAVDETAALSRIGPDFYTMTLAELYIRQGHLDMAADVLEEMIRKDPEDRKTQARLAEVKMRIGYRSGEGPSSRRRAVIDELERWLKNADRIKGYAA